MFRLLSALLVAAATVLAQNLPRIEISGSWWRPSPEGTIQSGIIPIDLQTDLAMRTDPQFFGTALIRVGGKHRIVIEGSPLRFSGRNRLNRTIVYNNRTYSFQDVITSEADLTYFFVGHQWDFIARERGNFGIRTGAAYLDANGSISSETTGITASSGYRIGIPLAGLGGEVFLVPRVLEIHGNVQGIPLGGYGHYVQGAAGAGAHFGPVGVRAAYRFINADVHERGAEGANRAGVAPQLGGPVISLVFRR
jgi:hypothetical protein